MTKAGFESAMSDLEKVKMVVTSAQAWYDKTRYSFTGEGETLDFINDESVVFRDLDNGEIHIISLDQINAVITYDEDADYNKDEDGNPIPSQPIFYQG